MMSTSAPPRPLVISLSAPLRITSARTGDPDASIAAAKPCAIDNTETSTITTPAMPTIATPDEPRRCGMVRRLTIVTASVCLRKFTVSYSLRPSTSIGKSQWLASPERVSDLEVHRVHCRPESGDDAKRDHESRARPDVPRRQHEDWQHAIGGI